MTRAEALLICEALRNGKSFATRFQEEEWGLQFDRDGHFRKWSHRVSADGGDEHSSESLNEEQLIELLVTWYGYQRINAGLR